MLYYVSLPLILQTGKALIKFVNSIKLKDAEYTKKCKGTVRKEAGWLETLIRDSNEISTQRKAVVSEMKCRVAMTGTHKDEGLGIIEWKVILVKVNRGIIHRCDNIHYSLHKTCRDSSNISSKLLSLWCLKEREQSFGK